MLKAILNIGILPRDSHEEQIRKKFLVFLALFMSGGGILWGSICLYFNLLIPSLIPFGYVVVTAINLLQFAKFRSFQTATIIQILISLALPFLFQFGLGGFISSGAVLLWSILALLGVIALQKALALLIWFFAYLVGVIALGYFDDFAFRAFEATNATSINLFVVNICAVSTIIAALMFYFVTSRDKATEELKQAKGETDNILKALNEGLLIIQPDGTIGLEFSQALEKLIDMRSFTGKPFTGFCQSLLKTKFKATSLDSFLKVLLSSNMPEKKIETINPLSDIEVFLEKKNEIRNLSFRFRPVRENKKTQYVLVTIDDRTEEIKLQKEVEDRELRTEKEIKTLFAIINNDPRNISTFLDDTATEFDQLEKSLNTLRHSDNYERALQFVFRAIHTIKGNASLIHFEQLAEECHTIEEKIKKFKAEQEFTSKAVLAVLASVAQLKAEIKQTDVLLNKISSFQKSNSTESNFLGTLATLIADIANDEAKQVQFNYNPADEIQIKNKIIRDGLVQLARNSVVHGIESPNERKLSQKPEKGTISLKLEKSSTDVTITFEDDGGGINIKGLRAKALEKSANKAKINSLTDAQVARLIFEPGMTTRDKANMHGGQGIGLDLVKSKIEKLGGKVKVAFSPGRYTRFMISLPIEKIA